jgi:hypothetical protein
MLPSATMPACWARTLCCSKNDLVKTIKMLSEDLLSILLLTLMV